MTTEPNNTSKQAELLAEYFVNSSTQTQEYLESGDMAKDIQKIETSFALGNDESREVQENAIGYLLDMISLKSADDNISIALRARETEDIQKILKLIHTEIYKHK
ncbi:hypothetical protein CL684_00385 [Candidatus Campbellbacteria bacterium]|nr:hypothetical protein [Candidatus Campbellbacteria bacterium]|tara:strand:+ start:3615 stop:3929 length:315 start_codon:yes stop_codon:yes gene_type:complete